jgi:hypothetical protein
MQNPLPDIPIQMQYQISHRILMLTAPRPHLFVAQSLYAAGQRLDNRIQLRTRNLSKQCTNIVCHSRILAEPLTLATAIRTL